MSSSSLWLLAVDRRPGRRSGAGPGEDGRGEARKNKTPRRRSFLLEVASATFNLPTTFFFGIWAHVRWTFWRVCFLRPIGQMSGWSPGAPPRLRCSDEYSDRDSIVTIAARVGSLPLGISPPWWGFFWRRLRPEAPPYCPLGRSSSIFSTRWRLKKKNTKHSSSSSLFFVEKLVGEPGQVNELWVDL